MKKIPKPNVRRKTAGARSGVRAVNAASKDASPQAAGVRSHKRKAVVNGKKLSNKY